MSEEVIPDLYEHFTDFLRIDEASMKLMSQLFGNKSVIQDLSKFSGVSDINVNSFLKGDWGGLEQKDKIRLAKCFKGYAGILKQKIQAEIEDEDTSTMEQSQ